MLKIFSKKKSQPEEVAAPQTPEKRLTIEDITDEDMMVAALVSSIDYQEESKGNVRVVSIKQL